jgi:CheY-like chemotaxis protein
MNANRPRDDLERRLRARTISGVVPSVRPGPEPGPVGAPAVAGVVLLVEDDESARLIVASYLSEVGWEVLAAASGEEALALVRARRGAISVLLTDFSLGATTGEALARDVRREAPSLPVVYMSGYGDLGALDPAGKVLPKPIALPEIARVLTEACAGG